jgi:NAD(P)-dependent dehydrogenase (short-subunit alcohol dehydrogenase family)
VPIRANLSDIGDMEALASRLSTSHLDRIYLSAGANQPASTGGVTERLRIIEPYFRLIFSTYIALTEHLIEKGALSPSSRVVAISSLAAAVPFPQLELYSAGKAALEGWCRGARDRGGPGFTVVRPGLFKSEFFRPSEVLHASDLPLQRAAKIVRLIDQDRDFVDVGGWRDVTVSRLSSLLGPRACRILPEADLDGSSVLVSAPGRQNGAT